MEIIKELYELNVDKTFFNEKNWLESIKIHNYICPFLYGLMCKNYSHSNKYVKTLRQYCNHCNMSSYDEKFKFLCLANKKNSDFYNKWRFVFFLEIFK